MKLFSLKSVIDDILLIIRNNNISESEDFSRAQIAAWILAYKALIVKERQDKKGGNPSSNPDESLQSTIGPLELEPVESPDETNLHRKRTVEKLPEISGDSDDNMISVHDYMGAVIQFMHQMRRHYHYYRKYTFGELVCWYDNGYIYVEGLTDLDQLKYIYVTGVFSGEDAEDEDDVTIPAWMVPQIKKNIMDNELRMMVTMPSDDNNNSSHDDIKPQAPAAGETF